MCGIVGWVDWTARPKAGVVQSITDALVHRGPDHGDVVELDGVALGHRRLVVIDLSAEANQPMFTPERDLVLTFNGEIYNFRELKAELEAKGHRFRTNSDTETILHAYREWGEACIERLDGMFAIALWDTAKRQILLARDRLGEKPLVYARLPDGGLVFASEVRALAMHPDVPLRLSPAGISNYLSLSYQPGEDTLIAGVQRVPPAHTVLIKQNSRPRTEAYWQLLDHFGTGPSNLSSADMARELADLTNEAVTSTMVSDTPLGAFLSGGVDSAIVTSAMVRARGTEPVDTFSTGFDVPTYSEIDQARDSARHIGSTHHDLVVGADIGEEMSTILKSQDEPMADTSVLPMYYLARFAREHVTVALSGDGADELFAGYPTYAANHIRRMTAWVPGSITRGAAALARKVLAERPDKLAFDDRLNRFLLGHGLDEARAHYSWRLILRETEKAQLLNPDVGSEVMAHDPFEEFNRHAKDAQHLDPLNRSLYVDLKTWLPGDILVKVDRCSMAHSLEVRAPYLRHKLVEFAAGLPPEVKFHHMKGKRILKQAFNDVLPDGVRRARKTGFNAPVSTWARGAARETLKSFTDHAGAEAVFDRRSVDRLWREHLNEGRDHGLKLLQIAAFGAWVSTLGEVPQVSDDR